MVARTKAPDRGTKAEQLFVIANVGVPAVLVEAGFLSNKEDIAKLESNDYREQMAAAISEGILRYRDVLKERQLPLAVTGPGTENSADFDVKSNIDMKLRIAVVVLMAVLAAGASADQVVQNVQQA